MGAAREMAGGSRGEWEEDETVWRWNMRRCECRLCSVIWLQLWWW